MDKSDVAHGVNLAWSILTELDLAESFSTPGVLPMDARFRDLALDGSSRYSSLYMLGLNLSYYNILLSDHSFLHFGWTSDFNVRYAYYPNPFVSERKDVSQFKGLRELVDSELITVDQYHHLLSEKQAEGRIPLIRYENAPSQWKEFRHPCSHWHIGHHSENRWPANRILTPLAFVLIVCKQYYSEEWAVYGDDESSAFGNRFDERLIGEKTRCPIVASVNFTENESRSFYWA